MKKQSKKRSGEPEQPKGAMVHKGKSSHPGLERNNKGEAIPVEKRLPEDRVKAHRAAQRKKS